MIDHDAQPADDLDALEAQAASGALR